MVNQSELITVVVSNQEADHTRVGDWLGQINSSQFSLALSEWQKCTR